jgi:phage gpG-like protein
MARATNIRITRQDRTPQFLEQLQRLARQEVFIGMQGDAELAMIAGVHEYGSVKEKIPARSFIGVGKKRARSAITKRIKAGLKAIADGTETTQRLQHDIGEIGKQKILERIAKMKKPKLTARYAKEKGNKKLLIDEDRLKESIMYKVGVRGSHGQ